MTFGLTLAVVVGFGFPAVAGTTALVLRHRNKKR